MVPIASLWLPILLSAVIVFFVSFVLHSILPFHRSDYGRAQTEGAALDALRGTPPGDYLIPHSVGPAAMKDPAYIEKVKRGPIALITVLPSPPPSIAKNLVQWFVYSLIVGVFAAYIAGRTLGPGAPYSQVFRFVGTTSFACYGLALPQNSIWFGKKWSTTFKSLVDSLIYGLLAGGTFGWLWPD